MTNKTHDENGEWRLWPSESPPLLSYEGVDFRRIGGPVGSPDGIAGTAYTPGGGLILQPWPASPETLREVWVLDHENVVRHYVAVGATAVR